MVNAEQGRFSARFGRIANAAGIRERSPFDRAERQAYARVESAVRFDESELQSALGWVSVPF